METVNTSSHPPRLAVLSLIAANTQFLYINLCIFPNSLKIMTTGTPPAYPLRTAQRNLNKILFGAGISNDPSDEFGPDESPKTTTPPKSMIEIDNLLDKILDVESSSASMYDSSVAVATTGAKKSSTTECYRPSQQYESSAIGSNQRQTDARPSETHSAQSGKNDSTAKFYGQDDVPLLQVNNNISTAAAVSTKQTKGVRNALMSELDDFNSLNSMIATQQDNATGQYFLPTTFVFNVNAKKHFLTATNWHVTTIHKSFAFIENCFECIK